jgi:hypothetical protein
MPRRGVAFALLLGALVVPIWYVPFFPSQDGPSHVYNAQVLSELGDPANYQVRHHYALNRAVPPNLLAHAILAGLQRVAPPVAAEKLLISAILLLLPLSLWRLIEAVEPGRGVYALAGMPFAYHTLLHLGFYSFSLGISLCFFTLAFWWRRRSEFTAGAAAGLSALLLVTYLAHFVSFGIAVAGLGISLAWDLLIRRDVAPQARLRSLATGVALLLPFAILALDYYLRAGEGRILYREDGKLLREAYTDLVLVFFTTWHRHLAPFLVGALGAGLLWTVADRIRRPRLAPADALLLLGVLLIPAYFLLPSWIGSGGWLNQRVYLFCVLFLWAGLAPPPGWLRIPLAIVLLGCAAAQTGRATWEYARLQPELHAATAAAGRIPPHSTVGVEYLERDAVGAFGKPPRKVDPFRHIHSYYGFARDVALLDNYEVRYPYFPIRSGEAAWEDPDYLLLWPLPDGDPVPAELREGREVLHRNDGAALLRRLPQAPPPWEGALELDPLSADDTAHSAWFGLRPGYPVPSGDEGPLAGPALADDRDRVLKLRLPDGRYRVTLGIPEVRDGRMVVEVYTEEGRALRHRIDAGAGPTQATLEVDARSGAATLVFHTPPIRWLEHGRIDRWAVSWLRVERADSNRP